MKFGSAKSMVLLFVGSVVVGVLLLVLVYAIPSSWMQPMFNESVEILQQEGSYRDINQTDSTSTLDNFTTAVMLDETIHTDVDGGGVIHAAMFVGRHDNGDANVVDDLALAAQSPATVGYEWYWHGYLVLLKPLLVFFNIVEIRTLLFLVLTLALMMGSCLLFKRTNCLLLPAAYATSFVAVNYFAASQPPSLALVFVIAALAVVWILRHAGKGDFGSERHLAGFFFFVGVLTAYFDFFTTPVVSLGYPLIAYCIVKRSAFRDPKWASIAKTVILVSLCWVLGYGLFWASKWALASVMLGYDVIRLAMDHIFLWSGVVTTGGQAELLKDANSISTIAKNLSMLVSLKMLVLLAASLVVIALVSRCRVDVIGAKQALVVGIVSLYPLLWYCVTSSHAFWHTFLTFRSLSVLLFGVLSAWIMVFRNNDFKGVFAKRKATRASRGQSLNDS